MSDRHRLEAVDAALESARRAAREERLPPALRARILAATRPSASAMPLSRPPAPRARLVDFVLRTAAVAAVFVVALLAAPVTIEAAELDAKPLVEWNARVADVVAQSLPTLDVADAPEVPAGWAWPAGAAAAALLAAGVWWARKDGRR
jgi:hypothetical protein